MTIRSVTLAECLLVAMSCCLLCGAAEPGDKAVAQPTPPEAKSPPPTLPDAHALRVKGEYDRAVEAYDQLAAESKTRLEATLGLVDCLMHTGDYDQAGAKLTELNATYSAEWHLARADHARITGAYDEALAHCRQAIKLEKGNTSARLKLATMLDYLGRRDEAIEAYRWFERLVLKGGQLKPDAAWLTDVGQGFLRYSVLTQKNVARRTNHVLNEMLLWAYERIDRSYWPARLAAADLLREKYNNSEFDGSVSDYKGALAVNPKLSAAHVGLGLVSLESWDFEAVEKHIEAAMEVNSIYPPALRLRARLRLVERRYPQAIKACDEALAVNPNDLEAIALRAAASACRFDSDDVERMRARAAAIAPQGAMFHQILGDGLSAIRQYADSAEAFLAAIKQDPTNANACTELGMMYMQWGREDQAREVLDAAFKLDPYNERTKFTLDLLDKIQKLSRHETEHFIIRYSEETDPGMGLYVADFMEDVYDQVTGDFGVQLEEKTIIEIFPTSEAFGVRITGKPWIFTVGACTGRVIALSAPRRDPKLIGTYNIYNVLVHEFTHTVTLAATRNRIPHWYTEGLAVYEEDVPRSFSWCAILADAVRRDELFTLETVNWGFIRPKKRTDRQQAYAQSEWMVEYIVGRFGYDRLAEMLALYADGKTEHEVFTTLMGIEPTTFDQDFSAWARQEASSWCFELTKPEDPQALQAQVEQTPDDAALIGRLARAQYEADDAAAARDTARHALTLDPDQRDALLALALAQSQLSAEAETRAAVVEIHEEMLDVLGRLQKVDPDNWRAAGLQASIYLYREMYDKAEEALKRVQALCPADPSSFEGLAGIYLDRHEPDLALPQLLELARTEEHDPDVPAKIARIYAQRDELREAQYWLRRAMMIAPLEVGFHKTMGDVSMRAGDTKSALTAYRMLTRLTPDDPKVFERAAFASAKLGDKDAAARFARQAVNLDPSSSARSLVAD